MMEYNLGKVLLTPKGEYNSNTKYEVLDVVSYNGSSYAAKQETTGNTPTGGNVDAYWQLMAYGSSERSGSVTGISVDNQQYGPDANGIVTLPNYPSVPEEVFWAVRGTTTAAEIDAAVEANKIVMLRDSGFDYILVSCASNNNNIAFYSGYSTTSRYIIYRRNQQDWVGSNFTLENAGNKVTSLSSASTDTEYPSAKCVYDSLPVALTTTELDNLWEGVV